MAVCVFLFLFFLELFVYVSTRLYPPSVDFGSEK